MEPELAIELVSNTMFMIIKLSTVLITPSLLTGLVIAIIQSATQVNEQTMSFLPRFIITVVCVIFGGHWMLSELQDYWNFVMVNIATINSGS
ncbi:flagellar biosynthetic protein FliQ [Vibrio breoganii]